MAITLPAKPNAPGSDRVRVGMWRWILVVLAMLAAIALCLQHGFEEPPVSPLLLLGVQLASILAYVFSIGAAFWSRSSWRTTLRRRWFDLLFVLVAGVLLSIEFQRTGQPLLSAGAIYVVTIQSLLVVRILIGIVRWNVEVSSRQLRPARWLVTSFVGVIFIGACLLALPKAMSPEARLHAESNIPKHLAISAFTATSATCVTGLAVYDTANDYSHFGQIVILVLIQLGGLGIMITSTLFGLFIRKNLSLKQSLILQNDLQRETVGSMRSVAQFVVIITVVLEAIGALLCYPMFASTVTGTGNRIFFSVFHAISAFCNAGFALQSDSLASFDASWSVYVSIMPLIVLGGLGFPVLQDLWQRLTFRPAITTDHDAHPASQWRPFVRRRPKRLLLHTRLVLWSSLWLVLIPAIMFFVFESFDWRAAHHAAVSPDMMVDMTWAGRARAALFQSVTARTAGFNTVSMNSDAISPASHFLMMLLMFVGGSPASTAGGIKTVTVAVLGLGLWSTLRRRERIELFGRTIPRDIVERAGVLVLLMFALISGVVITLSMTESAPLRDILFESVSACGTVGLSCGLSAQLTTPGQFIIMLAMFAGRLGPLTVMVALADKTSPPSYEYPIERVTIG